MHMNRIPIFFTFDNDYVRPAAVAFWSLLDRTKEGVFWEMWVLHHDISDDGKKLLEGIVARSGKGELKFIDTGDFLKDEWSNGSWEGHQTRTQFSSDTVVRCFGARFFPQYDKIIYSDVDVVFADDISDLWDVSLEDAYLAGVRGFLLKYDEHELSHLKPEHYQLLKDSYLAGGIWVVNLKKIREEDLEAKMLEIIKDDTIVKRWNDQDVMNIACAGKVKFLPLNYIGYPYLWEYLAKPDFTSHYTRNELHDSVLHPKIIHYAGRKPWNSAGVGYDENWWAIADYLELGCERPPRFLEEERSRLKRRVNRYRRRLYASLVVTVLTFVGLVLIALA